MRLHFDEDSFVRAFLDRLLTPGVRPVAAVSEILSQQIENHLNHELSGLLIKPASFSLNSAHTPNYWAVLPELAETGYVTWYPELRFSSRSETSQLPLEFEETSLKFHSIDYGLNISRSLYYKIKTLKSQINHYVRFNKVTLEKYVFSRALEAMQRAEPLEQPYSANPAPKLRRGEQTITIGVNEFVSFDHIVSGQMFFCSCAQSAHDKIRAHASEIAHSYMPDSWPYQVIEFLSEPAYLNGLCHLCTARAKGPEAAALRYGHATQVFVKPYIHQFVQGFGMDDRTARAEVQRLLGLNRWKRETELYEVVKTMFADCTVLREASPHWLGRQRLDIFLPQVNLAIEYQGEQHYSAVAAFGGDDALAKTVGRDALKRSLCEKNGVNLVCIRFDESMSVAALKNRLRRFLPSLD